MDDGFMLPVERSGKDDDHFKGKKHDDDGEGGEDFVFHGGWWLR